MVRQFLILQFGSSLLELARQAALIYSTEEVCCRAYHVVVFTKWSSLSSNLSRFNSAGDLMMAESNSLAHRAGH